MATNPQLAKSAAAGFPWGRLWFLLGALVVYRIGAHVPVPGVDPVQLAALFKSQEGDGWDLAMSGPRFRKVFTLHGPLEDLPGLVAAYIDAIFAHTISN